MEHARRRRPAHGHGDCVRVAALVADDATVPAVFAAARDAARAMRRAYGCDGTSTREHNGPGAGQEIPHLHVHVFPRHARDGLYRNDPEHRFADAAERRPYAELLRTAL